MATILQFKRQLLTGNQDTVACQIGWGLSSPYRSQFLFFAQLASRTKEKKKKPNSPIHMFEVNPPAGVIIFWQRAAKMRGRLYKSQTVDWLLYKLPAYTWIEIVPVTSEVAEFRFMHGQLWTTLGILRLPTHWAQHHATEQFISCIV